MVALAPDRVRTSEWLAAEQRLFVSVHALWNCEVLVVPFAAGSPSVDRPARSLITRYVAAELAARSGKCVADPTLVARALGSRRRAVAEADVEALADAMNARWVVRGSITRDEEQPKLTLALRLDQRSGPKQWGRGAQTQWGPLEFSDELPPEAAFARIARQVSEGLGLELEAGADAAPSARPSWRHCVADHTGRADCGGRVAVRERPRPATAGCPAPSERRRRRASVGALARCPPRPAGGGPERAGAACTRGAALVPAPVCALAAAGARRPGGAGVDGGRQRQPGAAEPLARAVKDPCRRAHTAAGDRGVARGVRKDGRVGGAPSGAPRQSSRLCGAAVCGHVGQRSPILDRRWP